MSSSTPDTTAREFIGSVEQLLQQPLHPMPRALIEYWCSIKAADRLPGRQHFEPMAIPHLLPNIWLLDVERSPGLCFRYRLIGTNVVRALGDDPTGAYLDAVHDKVSHELISTYLREVVGSRLPSWRRGRPQLRSRQKLLRLERVYLPMARDGSTVDMILALAVFVDEYGREF